jgi:aminoglycoside phosphotransferase (APT) family kinase protein
MDDDGVMSPDTSHRLRWWELPALLRNEVRDTLGSAVVEAVGQRGGYGPGLAARCVLADGRRVFVKAVSAVQNPDTPMMMRHEAEIARSLSPATPAPRLLHTIDDGPWIILVFEDIDGRLPVIPWGQNELQRVVAAVVALADVPVPRALPTVAERYRDLFTGWRQLSAEDPASVRDDWCRAHLHDLAVLEPRWEGIVAGRALVHGDVRSDNILLARDDRILFVDWTTSCVGARWFDLLSMLPSIELEGGGLPESVLELAGFTDLPRDEITPVVTALAGYFADRSRRPDPPGLPTVRAFQRAQCDVTIAWLRRLLEK